MRILYVHQYFKTPQEGSCIRSYYLAKGLVKNGFEVHIITGHNSKEAITKDVDGINVHYLPVDYDNSFGKISRLIAFLKFIFLAVRKTEQLPRFDLCYAMTTPLSVGFIALYSKFILRVPYVFEVGDIWPEAPIQMGFIKNKLVQKISYSFEKLCYRQALGNVALSPPIAKHIKSLAPERPVTMIPNLADLQFFKPYSQKFLPNLEKPLQFVKNYGLEGKFVITYMGAAGKANHLEYVLKMAYAASVEKLNVHFLLLCRGAEKRKLKALAKAMELNNLTFYPYQDKKGLLPVLQASDAVVVSFANFPILRTGSPNKLIDGLAAGKMIISNFEGWTADLIREYHCGVVVNPENTGDFLDQIKPYMENPELLKSAQKNARKLAEEKFSKSFHIKKQIGWLEALHANDFGDDI